jgi:L-lactate dehydrogenase complex protein LldE
LVVRASLFATCIVDQIFPEVGDSTVNVLSQLGVEVDFPSKQTCCGQPAFNSGFWNEARPLAKRFLQIFEGDNYIVAPSGSCAAMVRNFYAELFNDDPDLRDKSVAIAPRVFELSEFIVDVLGIDDLSNICLNSKTNMGSKTVYHPSCHLVRELHVVNQPRKLISSLPGIELVTLGESDVCCGFGGSFSVKYSDISGAMLQDKLDNIVESGASRIVSCDSSCIMHIDGGLKRQNINTRPVHIAQLMEEAICPK